MSTVPPPPPSGSTPDPQEPTAAAYPDPAAQQYQAPQYQAPQYQAAQHQAPQYQAGPSYGGPQYGYAPARPNNQMALVSLIAGIAGWTVLPFLASIVAVVTGHMAKRQIRETGEGGDGMATAGLALGYTMIGIGLLIALGFLLFWGVLAASVSTTGSFG